MDQAIKGLLVIQQIERAMVSVNRLGCSSGSSTFSFQQSGDFRCYLKSSVEIEAVVGIVRRLRGISRITGITLGIRNTGVITVADIVISFGFL